MFAISKLFGERKKRLKDQAIESKTECAIIIQSTQSTLTFVNFFENSDLLFSPLNALFKFHLSSPNFPSPSSILIIQTNTKKEKKCPPFFSPNPRLAGPPPLLEENLAGTVPLDPLAGALVLVGW